VLKSPMVCDPLHLLEICPVSDGAGAIIVTSLDNAKKYT
jgi:acetyl-CoA acetyltransferase